MESTTDSIAGDALGRVRAYQLAMEAVREERADVKARMGDPAGTIEEQLLRSLGSIGANIAEGYSRGTASDRRRFFEYALGSTREALVWYETILADPVPERLARLVAIRRLLLTMIRSARMGSKGSTRPFEP